MLQRLRCFDSFTLKMIAIVAMTFDHVGYSIYPDSLWMRIIGRLTFPIMAFLIAEGYRHTRDMKQYMYRLLIFALISMPAFYLLFGWPLNVFFTLLAGLFALHITGNMASRSSRFWTVLAISTIVCLCDWGFPGVWAIYLMGRIKNPRQRILFSLGLLFVLALLVNYITAAILGYQQGLLQWLNDSNALFYSGIFLTIPLLLLYNGQRGIRAKYLFYVYYPLHLFAIAAVKWLM